jgi:hypothetical protein
MTDDRGQGVWRISVELDTGDVFDDLVIAPDANTALVLMGIHLGAGGLAGTGARIIRVGRVPVGDYRALGAINFPTSGPAA